MYSYNKKPATAEELNKIAPSIHIFHYNKKQKVLAPQSYTDSDMAIIASDLQTNANLLKYILSNISKRIHLFQQGNERLDYFMKTGWKVPILTNTPSMAFLLPEQFTQEFIDSKEGKRFKGKAPCVHMFMRALQSQKTIMEQLEVVEV